ncbi:MAG TPA: SGNH/GDSL hydrolase family protein [Thermoanaerobaculia bacterium]|nr:SGNH/GDSL hydrolase family protein [Thermoanaerobaculia bacterium]
MILRLKERREQRLEVARWKATRPDFQFIEYSKIYSDERDTHYKFGHKPNVKVKLDRGYYTFTMITNSEGLRESLDYPSLPKSVIFLGDSIVEGASVENHETMDSVFEARTGVTALNFGVASRGGYLAYEYLRAKYRPEYSPRLVVLGFCINDFEEATYVRYFDDALGHWFLSRYMDDSFDLQKGFWYRLSRAPLIGSIVRVAHDRYREAAIVKAFSDPPGTDPTRLPPKDNYGAEAVISLQLQYTDIHIRLLKEFTDSIGARLVVVLLPPKGQLALQYGRGQRLQEMLIPILQRNGIPYVDLYDTFKENVAHEPDVRWYHDELHFYARGHQLAGEFLAIRLKEMFPAVF